VEGLRCHTDQQRDLDGAHFSARSVKAQRRKTGLSAADYAKLIDVSALTIYNWEQAKSRPRKEQLASLVAVRALGKRQAMAKLESLNGALGRKSGRKKK
jgi:DNA-binding transcriptional regulator YiaG